MSPPQPRSTLFPYTTLFRSEIISAPVSWPWGSTTKEVKYVCGSLLIHSRCQTSLDSSRMTSNTEVMPIAVSAAALLRSEEHTSELQSLRHLVCRLLLEKKKI